MTVELVRETLKSDHTLVQVEIQVIVEANGIVPDTKGDVLRVLSVDAIPTITSAEVQKDKVLIEGTIKFKALYLAAEGQSPIDNVEVTATFKEVVQSRGTKEKMAASVMGTIEHVDYVIENSRKMRLRAVAGLKLEVTDIASVDVVKDIRGFDNIQLLKNSIKYTEVIGENSSQTVIRETVEMEEEEIEIEEILRVDAKIISPEVKVVDNKVIVSATADISILYWGDRENFKINQINHQLPFTHFVDIPGAYSNMEGEVDFDIEELFTDVKENIIGQKRILDVEAVINVKAKASESHEIEVITDAYCPGKGLELAKNKVNLRGVLEVSDSKVSVKDTMETELNNLPIERIFSIAAKPMVAECRVLEDKCIVEGVVDIHVLYGTEDKNQPILSLKSDIPFRHFIEVPNQHNVDVKAKANVAKVNYNVVSGDTIELDFDIDIQAAVIQQYNMDIVTKITEKEGSFPVGPKASMVIYVVQPEDTLWDIAKQYNTTIDDIMATNDIEDVDSIMPGEQIIIQKSIKYSIIN